MCGPYEPLTQRDAATALSSLTSARVAGAIQSIAHQGDASPCGGNPYVLAFGPVVNNRGDVAYVGRIGRRDRWAIIAYIRALQLSQHARIEDVPEAERAKLIDERSR